MKKISITTFTLLLLAFLILLHYLDFFTLIKAFEKKYATLIVSNVQSRIILLRHTLKKSLKRDTITSTVSTLDNFVNSCTFIANIQIVDPQGTLLYSSQRNAPQMHSCLPLRELEHQTLLDHSCYFFTIPIFHGLESQRYTILVVLDKSIIHSFIKEQKRRFYIQFFTVSLLTLTLFGLFLHYFLVRPLHRLRLYTQDHRKLPPPFLISELETIRLSLKETFTRLIHEQQKLFHLSTKDSLTGLYNRHAFMDRLQELIEQASRSKTTFALLFIDLDNFKQINDTHDHTKGDTVLKEIAQRLKHAVRKSDIIARLGGDEFVVLVPELKNETDLFQILYRIQNRLEEPLEGFEISASIGIVLFPKDGSDAQTLLKNADLAMYRAKREGKRQFYFFTQSLHNEIQEEIYLQNLMKEGLSKGYFKLYYQPQKSFLSHELVGCEALLRLHDPNRGIITPDRFIPIAEQTGLINDIRAWVLDEVVRQLTIWRQTPLANISISINVSASQLKGYHFIEQLQDIREKIDPSRLQLELTENLFALQQKTILQHLLDIKAMGFSLALDDFGTGYSSLAYLKKIPFDTLKIDKSFVEEINDPKNRQFVQTIVAIAKIFSLTVVAEGVETDSQFELLHTLGCDICQGFLCDRPLPIETFEKKYRKKE